MVLRTQSYTTQEFEDFTRLSENRNKLFELIAGRIVEVPSNPYVSAIASEIIFLIKLFLRETGIKGIVTGEQGGYRVSGERYAPDVAFISGDKQLVKEGYNPDPPDLAVEVVSPNDVESDLLVKVGNYLAAGVVVWVVRPVEQQVLVYAPDKDMKVVEKDEFVDGGTVLPGFKLLVKDIFASVENM